MVKIRNTEVYKYIDDSKTCYKDIHQNIPIGQNDSLKSEQYGCIDMQCVLTMGTYVLIFVQRIWCYLFLKGSATMKYLGVLNQEANFQFHTEAGTSKWKLNQSIFEIFQKAFWTLGVEFSASRISHLVSVYIVGKQNPFSKGEDVFQESWKALKGNALLTLPLKVNPVRRL